MSTLTTWIIIALLVTIIAISVYKSFMHDSLIIRRHERRKVAEEKFAENILALDETADVKHMLEKYRTVEEIEK